MGASQSRAPTPSQTSTTTSSQAQSPSTASATSGQSGRAGMGNAARAEALPGSPGAGACVPEVHLPTPVAANGDLGYYHARHADFTGRYPNNCPPPPDYYLGYGNKYVTRFTLETAPRLTPEGQAWLGRARVNLQVAIENRREQDPEAFDQLEKNNAAFRSFCFGTHADAYWNAGLGDLNLFDLAQIGLTPDVPDLLAWDGVTQAADIGSRLFGVWGEDAIDYVGGEGTTRDLVDAAYEGYGVVGQEIDEVFGEGTAARLEEGARELGADAVDLTHGAYDRASQVVGDGAGLLDEAVGEPGWTGRQVDGARRRAQDGVDWAEGVWDDIF